MSSGYDKWGRPIGGTSSGGYDRWGRPIGGSGGGSNSSLWPDFLSNNPVSEAVGHAGDWLSHNPVTSVGTRFVTGPHQLVDFATHDWIASLIALGHLGVRQAREEAHHGVRGILMGPLGYESPSQYWNDQSTLAGGLVHPMIEGYNTKYQWQNIAEDTAAGRWDEAAGDVGQAGHNMAQDPFGTLLDVTVAGKALDAAHLTMLERASAAGKLKEGSLARRIADRVLDESPREFRVYPSKDRLGNDYVDAKGVLITKSYRAKGTAGRLFQSYIDELRLALPENLPFSAHRLSSKEILRQVNQVFQRNAFHIKAAAELINKLPEGLQYALQHVAELPRDVATIGGDPIGHMLEFYKRQLDALKAKGPAAGESDVLYGERVEALDHRIEVMSRVDQVKDAIYDPEHPDHAKFREAFDAAHDADQRVRRELVRRGLVKQDLLDAQDVLVHRSLRGVHYDIGHPQSDVLGSYTSRQGGKGQTTEQAIEQEAAALESHAGSGEAPSSFGSAVVHRYPLPADTIHPGRVAVLIDRRTGEIHIADPTGVVSAEGRSANAPSAAWHADLRQASGIPVSDHAHYIQASTGDAVPGLDIPRRWILPSDVPRDELDRIVDHLQQVENLPVETGDFEGMIPARAASEELHNPLAQYGQSWHWPHDAFAIVGAPVGLKARLHDFLLRDEPRSNVIAQYAEGMDKRPGDAWLEGLINSHPEALTTSHFHQWAEIRAKDYMDRFLYPMAGRLESGKGYEQGGKLKNETFIVAPRQYLEHPINSTKTHFATIGEVVAADGKLRQVTEGPLKETTEQWIERLNEAGLRRVKTKYVERWKRETDTSRTLFQRIVHGGINQFWRYLLLAIKPGWAAANAYTNQALVLLKNSGKGGIRAFLAMVRDSAGHSRLRKLAAYTRRMSLSAETKAEVEAMLGESMGDTINRIDPALHAATYGRSILFNPPRAGREVRVDAVTPQGKFLAKLAKHPGYSLRRALHFVGWPARFVERMNQAGERFARNQAYIAKTYQMTGKMAHNGPELERILREGKITGNEDRMQELLVGPNGPMDILGDYGRMSAREREYVTAVVPFYAWYKTILGITAKFFVRDTGRVWVLHNLAQALAVTAADDMQLGIPVPGFAKDLLPLFGPEGDSQLTLSTRTWNPFQTPVDLGNNAAALLGGPPTATPNEVGVGLLGPAFQGAYTLATGQDPFYGGEYRGWGSGQGRVGATVGSFFYGLPQKRLADQIRGDYKSQVFRAPPGDSPVPYLSNQGYVGLLQYLGIPVKYANLPALETRAIEEGHKPAGQTGARGYDKWGRPK